VLFFAVADQSRSERSFIAIANEEPEPVPDGFKVHHKQLAPEEIQSTVLRVAVVARLARRARAISHRMLL